MKKIIQFLTLTVVLTFSILTNAMQEEKSEVSRTHLSQSDINDIMTNYKSYIEGISCLVDSYCPEKYTFQMSLLNFSRLQTAKEWYRDRMQRKVLADQGPLYWNHNISLTDLSYIIFAEKYYLILFQTSIKLLPQDRPTMSALSGQLELLFYKTIPYVKPAKQMKAMENMTKDLAAIHLLNSAQYDSEIYKKYIEYKNKKADSPRNNKARLLSKDQKDKARL